MKKDFSLWKAIDEMEGLKEGWTMGYNLKKYHYFRKGISLCKKHKCGDNANFFPIVEYELMCKKCLEKWKKKKFNSIL